MTMCVRIRLMQVRWCMKRGNGRPVGPGEWQYREWVVPDMTGASKLGSGSIRDDPQRG
jgi:hypothetical protein